MNANKIDAIIKDTEYIEIVKDLIENQKFLETKNYLHHANTNIFEHSLHVSYCMYKYAKRKNLDYISAARAGLLHDFYLYDWHIKGSHKGLHGYLHPKIAYENASSITFLNDLEKDIILNHMWPLTIFHFPHHRESFIITIIDKQCSYNELKDDYKKIIFKKNENTI